jgi:hypothetical protein
MEGEASGPFAMRKGLLLGPGCSWTGLSPRAGPGPSYEGAPRPSLVAVGMEAWRCRGCAVCSLFKGACYLRARCPGGSPSRLSGVKSEDLTRFDFLDIGSDPEPSAMVAFYIGLLTSVVTRQSRSGFTTPRPLRPAPRPDGGVARFPRNLAIPLRARSLPSAFMAPPRQPACCETTSKQPSMKCGSGCE